jgi:lysophospholipase L1-like esterase
VLQAFNGEDATTPAGDLVAADYTHPSQKGNDLIRDLLLNR